MGLRKFRYNASAPHSFQDVLARIGLTVCHPNMAAFCAGVASTTAYADLATIRCRAGSCAISLMYSFKSPEPPKSPNSLNSLISQIHNWRGYRPHPFGFKILRLAQGLPLESWR
jgi:hypothetical protein